MWHCADPPREEQAWYYQNTTWQQGQLALAIQGLLGVNIPAEVGGVGGSFIDEQIVIEEGAYRYS